MILQEIPTTRRKDLETAIVEYNAKISSNSISPRFIRSLGLSDMFADGGMILAKAPENFNGIAIFHVSCPVDEEDLALDISAVVCNTKAQIWDLSPFNDFDYSSPLIYLSEIESFQPGTGKSIIEYLKNKSAGIYAVPTSNPETLNFYRKRGFEDQSISINGSHIRIMLWLNPNYASVAGAGFS